MANFKQQLFKKNKMRIQRAFEQPEPAFNACFLHVSAWFQQSTLLSKKNCEFGNKHIIKLREMAGEDLEKAILIDRLNELHRKALERIQRRAEKKAKLEAEGIKPGKPDGRRRKKVVETPTGGIVLPTAHLWGSSKKEKSDGNANQERILPASDTSDVA